MADQQQQQQQQQGGESAADLVLESRHLRGDGHRTQGANIALGLRFDDTVKKLESRGDREARKVLLALAKEVHQFSGALAARLARMSMVNRTVVEILEKSEDGKAALMMRKAAELLVKGLANAEEEVHSLKATVREVEGQRDHYKALLARTNSSLDAAQAYAQMSKAIGQGQQAAGGDSAAASSNSSGGGADDAVIERSAKRAAGKGGGSSGSGKGKAPARGAKQKHPVDDGPAALASRSAGGSGSGSGSGSAHRSGSGDEPVATKVVKGGSQHSEDPRGAAKKTRKGKGRTAAAAAAAPVAAAAAAAAVAGGEGARIDALGPMGRGVGGIQTTGNDAAGTTTTASKKRRREANESSAGSGGLGGGEGEDEGSEEEWVEDRRGEEERGNASPAEGGEEAGDGRRRRKGGGAASSTRRGRGGTDDVQIGVEVPVADAPTGLPWSGGGGGGEGSEVDDGLEVEDGGGSELYDSDDAPSMFF